MTALPLPPPAERPLLTVAQFIALPEVHDGSRYELVEGNLVMAPHSIGIHMHCGYRLLRRLEDQIPPPLVGLQEAEVDLRLVPESQPGFVRIPDLVVVLWDAVERQHQLGGLYHASEVSLAVEIISPGSRRLDTIVKRDEYADAGIPHYWIVDFGKRGDRPQLTAHHLAGEFGYGAASPVVGVFTTTEPFPVRLDLDALVKPPFHYGS